MAASRNRKQQAPRKAGAKPADAPRAAKPAAPDKSAKPAKAGAPDNSAKPARPAKARPDLGEIRGRIDGIDLQIQNLIQERAEFARLVGAAKGPLKAAVDYYRPER